MKPHGSGDPETLIFEYNKENTIDVSFEINNGINLEVIMNMEIHYIN